MTPERYQQIDQIFQAALELDPAQLPAFLDEACSGDGTLGGISNHFGARRSDLH
jgi:hypothetical protein